MGLNHTENDFLISTLVTTSLFLTAPVRRGKGKCLQTCNKTFSPELSHPYSSSLIVATSTILLFLQKTKLIEQPVPQNPNPNPKDQMYITSHVPNPNPKPELLYLTLLLKYSSHLFTLISLYHQLKYHVL